LIVLKANYNIFPLSYGVNAIVKVGTASVPPSAKGFVPLKWRWVSERIFGIFNFFRRLDKN